MTPKQKKLLDFIRNYIAEYEYGPTYDEMTHHLGMVSKGPAHRLVNKLVEQGYLRRKAAVARALEVIEKTSGIDLADMLTRSMTEAITAHGEYDGEETLLVFSEAEFRAFMAPLITVARR